LYQPWALEKAKTLGDKDDPSLRCVPTAFGTLNASLLDVGFVGQIVQTAKFVVFLTETYHGFPHHSGRWAAAPRRRRPVVQGRRDRALGGRYAGHRSRELHRHDLDER
jgi:hypothetical protein